MCYNTGGEIFLRRYLLYNRRAHAARGKGIQCRYTMKPTRWPARSAKARIAAPIPGYGEDPHCEAARALLREYKKLQMQLQLAAVAGAEVSNDDTQRFQQIGALLFAGENTSRFLLLEMRLQQTMADVFKTLSDAAGLDMPGM